MRAFLSAVALAAVTATPSLSQESIKATGQSEAVTPTDPWNYSLTPFVWGTGVSGIMSKGPLSVDIDGGFSTIVDNLDMGLMLDFRARRGQWEFGTNLTYADVSAGQTGPVFGVDQSLGLKLTILELDAKYYFEDAFFGYAGGRYIDVDSSLAIGAPVSASASSVNDWVDPYVGLGFNVPLSGKWSVVGKGDIGRFGIGSDFAWQAQAYIQYDSSANISILAGYRHLDFDYTDGGTRIDLAMTGPVFGVRIKF